jgi:glycosyltransferase involved in cell wall biosynthesis
VVAEFFLWPATNGGLMRGANSLEALADMGDLDLFVFHDGRKPSPVVPSTVPVSNLLTTDYPVAGRVLWRAEWVFRRGVPTQIASRMHDRGPRTDVAKLRGEAYDLVWFNSARAYHWLGRPRLGPTVVDLIDLEDVKERQRAEMIAERPTRNLSQRYRQHLVARKAAINAGDWARVQHSIAADVDRVLLCSEEDVERIGVPNAEVVVNSYPQPFPPVGREREGGSPVILLPATFDYGPNVDGATWLARDIAPLIRRLMPGAQIRLVGRSTRQVEALDHPPDVTVTGRVADMTTELAGADVVVVPVRFGSGTRLKILEAFAHRVPVVSTTIGAEGLGVEHRTHLLIADRPQEFADAIADLRSSPTLRRHIVDSAERLYLERFTSAAAQARVQQIAREVAGPEAVRRPSVRS